MGKETESVQQSLIRELKKKRDELVGELNVLIERVGSLQVEIEKLTLMISNLDSQRKTNVWTASRLKDLNGLS